jgi:hypothetical protein
LRLPRRCESPRRNVSVQIAQQQCALKKNQASRPHRRRPAEAWKNQFCEERLDKKKKKRPEENSRRQKQSIRRSKMISDSGS